MHTCYSHLVQDYVTAQNHGNFTIFKSLFDQDVQHEVKKKNFIKSQSDILLSNGKIETTDFLTSVYRNEKTWLLYKVTFDKSRDEFLLTVVVNDKNKNGKALGIWLN